MWGGIGALLFVRGMKLGVEDGGRTYFCDVVAVAFDVACGCGREVSDVPGW